MKEKIISKRAYILPLSLHSTMSGLSPTNTPELGSLWGVY